MFIIYFLRAVLTLILHIVGSLKVEGRENVPATGPYILVINHMSKADPPLVFLALPPMRMRFFAGEKWESHILFGPVMKVAGGIYINRGEVDRKALREALQALRGGSIFGLAPEGTRSKVGHLIKAKDGAAYLASRARVPVLPVGVVNSDVLGENVKRLRRTPTEVHIGEAFELPDLGRRPKGRDLEAYTHLIMVHIANLLPPRYHGYYADSPALAALQRGEDPWPHCREAVEPALVADAAEPV
ncbi:MAG: lysophospholipid acyltransferase family protein [Chloroflexota bacterium]